MRALLIIVVATWAAPRADAQSAGDPAALFDEGQRLIGEGKIDEACDKFDASLKLDPALGTRLNLADCREKQRRVDDAFQLYREVAAEAARTRKQSQLVYARERMDALGKENTRVSLRIASSVAGIAITIGGREREPARWSTPVLVEPGNIVVTATAPGHTDFTARQTGEAGATLTFDIPALVAESGDAALPRTPSRRRTITPWIVMGAGGALVVSSMILGLHAKSSYNDLLALDPRPADIETRIDKQQREADIATGLLFGGAITAAVGVVWYLRVRKAPSVTPITDGSTAGVAIEGTF